MVVHEAVRACGIGAEIAATIADEAFDFLDAPVKNEWGAPFYRRYPFAPALEKEYLPGAKEIVDAVRSL